MHTSINKAGFSLVEVVITMGIMGIVMVASLSTLDLIEQEKKSSMSATNLNDVKTTLQGFFGNLEICTRMMGATLVMPPAIDPANYAPVDITIYKMDGTTAWFVPAPAPSENWMGTVKIQQVKFINETGAMKTATDNFLRYVAGHIELTVKEKSNSDPITVRLPIHFKINTDSGLNTLIACKSTNPDERRPIQLPECNDDQMMIYDSSIQQWRCVGVP